MKTKSKNDLYQQYRNIEYLYSKFVNKHKYPYREQMERAMYIYDKYLMNINNHLGEYDGELYDDGYFLRFEIQIPMSIYASK